MRIYLTIKNIIDFIISGISLFFIIPFLVIIGLLVFINLGLPIFFVQERPGHKGKLFKLIKFRTMKNIYDEENLLLPDHKRQSKFGNWLRKSSLDELPEIINIFFGEMSFVGPRPLLTEYLDLYNQEQLSRHNVKPGITGLAQISGRNQIDWEEKLKYDIIYVNRISFWIDMKILFKTITVILSQSGISHKGYITMPRFKGNKNKPDE